MLTSCAYISVETRVMSAWNASACRSHINLMCSVNDSGIPNGTCASGDGSLALVTFLRRRSISRMSSRYSLSRARSVPGSVLIQAVHFMRDGVEQTGLGLLARDALLARAAVAEQALENDLRIGFVRQRLGGRWTRKWN